MRKQLFFNACTLLLTTAFATSQASSTDFVTYRYYGRRVSNFQKTKGYPENPWEVCRTFYAVCTNLRAYKCVQANAEMIVPFNHKVNNSEEDRYVIDPPKANAAAKGNYMLLSDNHVKWADNTGWKLWSGCDEGCHECSQGTGLALYPVEMPTMCGHTESGDVFGILWNKGDGSMNTEQQCVESLEAHWNEVDEDNNLHTIVSMLSVLGFLVCGAACGLFLWRHHRKTQLEGWRSNAAIQMPNFTGVALQMQSGQPPRIIGQTAIDTEFPVVSVTDEPQCVVCLVPVTASDSARRLQCNHVFHANCILAWWVHTPRSSLECPVCKQSQHLYDRDETTAASTSHSCPTEVGELGGQAAVTLVTASQAADIAMATTNPPNNFTAV